MRTAQAVLDNKERIEDSSYSHLNTIVPPPKGKLVKADKIKDPSSGGGCIRTCFSCFTALILLTVILAVVAGVMIIFPQFWLPTAFGYYASENDYPELYQPPETRQLPDTTLSSTGSAVEYEGILFYVPFEDTANNDYMDATEDDSVDTPMYMQYDPGSETEDVSGFEESYLESAYENSSLDGYFSFEGAAVTVSRDSFSLDTGEVPDDVPVEMSPNAIQAEAFDVTVGNLKTCMNTQECLTSCVFLMVKKVMLDVTKNSVNTNTNWYVYKLPDASVYQINQVQIGQEGLTDTTLIVLPTNATEGGTLTSPLQNTYTIGVTADISQEEIDAMIATITFPVDNPEDLYEQDEDISSDNY